MTLSKASCRSKRDPFPTPSVSGYLANKFKFRLKSLSKSTLGSKNDLRKMIHTDET